MRRATLLFCAAWVLMVMVLVAGAQIKGQGVEIGVAGGIANGQNEASSQNTEFNGRAFIGIPLMNYLGLDIGGGIARNSGTAYKTELVPIDARLRLGLTRSRLTPFLYAGFGMLNWNVKTVPSSTVPDYNPTNDNKGWTGFIPYGAGVQWRVSPVFALEISGGSNFTFSDYLNPVTETDLEKKDSFLSFMAGLRFAPGAKTPDYDHDGLGTKLEEKLGTDPRNPDTDGDGLDDYAEVNKYKTDPLKADTDDDGLTDSAELNTYYTNALKTDSDGDGLSDGEEVNQYKTDPLKADTDGDGLNDYAEVQTHKTNPLKADTDGGTVTDGKEVERGSNPLLASDDVPAAPKPPAPKPVQISLAGITFETNSAKIHKDDEVTLNAALAVLKENPNLKLEVLGYTDNVGSRESNVKLSENRANAVKQWLVNKGLTADRITIKGMGPDKPIADNATVEGRQQNRRVELSPSSEMGSTR